MRKPTARSSRCRRPSPRRKRRDPQASVSITFRQATAHTPPVFHPLAYRGVVAGWPVRRREQWGRRANDLEETGLSWRDAEAQAFVEVWNTVQ